MLLEAEQMELGKFETETLARTPAVTIHIDEGDLQLVL